jgi:MauM/NapG family ferredoxin protein
VARLQRWRRPVQVVTLLAFLLFVVLAALPQFSGLLRTVFRLDPLTALSASLATRRLVPGWPLALLVFTSALVAGRAWCGWLCPLGTLLDLLPARRTKPWDQPLSDRWRQVKWLLLTAILAMALLGSLTLLILDPLTLLTRAITSALWPAINWLVTAGERLAFAVPFLQPVVIGLDGLVRGTVLRMEPAAHGLNGLAAALLAGVLLLNAVRRRFWCRYLCPLGGLLAIPSRAALIRRQVVGEHCLQCHRCSRGCPTGTIDPERGYASDPAECIVCLDCVPNCRPLGNTFGVARPWPAASGMAYDPSRRTVLALAGGAVAGVALLRTGSTAHQPHRGLIQPPGAAENELLARCIRCGACLQACPSGGLQPSHGQAGLEGLWTPVLVPRLGQCDYACNACGQACPTGAIPALALSEKQQQVIGQASIDRGRCLAWAGDQPCIVCEEVCPVADKAIWLEEQLVLMRDGSLQQLQLPHVDRLLCIGCGICENKCPLDGPAAIQVFTPSALG